MEYRGYDSVGVATSSGGKMSLEKGVGRVSEVNEEHGLDALPGTVGIGHTRWATHGGVTRANAHPHSSSSGAVAVVHNGIIENFAELREALEAGGFSFSSETDTEVISNQLQSDLEAGGGPKEAMVRTLARLRGRYAFVAMFGDGTLAAARFHRPLIVGVGRGAYLLSSDVLGFVEQTDDAIYVGNGDFVTVSPGAGGGAELRVFGFDGSPARRQVTKISKEFADTYKGEYAHFTLKEICEQPDAVLRVGANTPGAAAAAAALVRGAPAGSVYVTGSGTSYNAALVAKHVMLRHGGVRVEPVMSSEFPHSPVSMDGGSVLLALSQSGETADVIGAAAAAKEAGARVASVVNVMNSSLAQESDVVVGMNCGPEIGVAATKSFTAQLRAIHEITREIAGGQLPRPGAVSAAISGMLEGQAGIKALAREMRDVSDVYVMGRGVHYPIAAEAALKLKELAYVHAEGIPGGELKHGPLALMDEGVYAVMINPTDSTHAATLTGAREIKARGARIIGVSDARSDVYDRWVRIPGGDEAAYPVTEIVPIQLLAYYLALEKDADPDYPRNLAKSVTVE